MTVGVQAKLKPKRTFVIRPRSFPRTSRADRGLSVNVAFLTGRRRRISNQLTNACSHLRMYVPGLCFKSRIRPLMRNNCWLPLT